MPARTMLSVTRELKATATVEFAAGVGTVETDPEIEVQIFELGGPIAGEAALDAAADGPARLGVVAADDGVDGIAVAVETEHGTGGHDLPDREPAGT